MISTRSETRRVGRPPNARELPDSPTKTRKTQSPSRSPARTRKSSPATRSPSRRSPGRPKTPTSKYPARKSPSRTTKETTENEKPTFGRPPLRTGKLGKEEKKLENEIKTRTTEVLRTSRTRRSEYTNLLQGMSQIKRDLGDNLNGIESFTITDSFRPLLRNRKSKEEVIQRRSSRLIEDDEKSDEKSISKSVERQLDEDSSGEEPSRSKSKSMTRELVTPLLDINLGKAASQLNGRWEFGGRIGTAVMILLVPITVFSVLLSCAQSCSFKKTVDLTAYMDLSPWFSQRAVVLFSAMVILQSITACLPVLGRKGDRMDGTRQQYCFNALFASIATVGTLFSLDFVKVVIAADVLNEYLRLAVLAYVFAIVLSIGLYVKSRKMDDGQLNPYGNTGHVLYDFWMGREIHPQFSKLDVKIWVLRSSNITGLILSTLLIQHGFKLPSIELDLKEYKELLSQITYQPTILVFAMMQLLYFLNAIVREHKITTTFTWQCEGVGYMQTVCSALYPFYFLTITKFIVDHNVTLSMNTLIAASVVYLVGFLTMNISNNVKYEYRKNPLQSHIIHLEAMPTFHGKKLLLSGLWGLVRHPNYTGDILIHLALAVPGALAGPSVALVPAISALVVLVHRASRDHSRCQRRYGAAWQRYCMRVPAIFVPKVY